MLTTTFCCFTGISASAERRLWEANCLSWKDLLVVDPHVFSEKKLALVRRQVREAEIALESGLADYFLSRLKGPDRIRILPHFQARVGYLDVETTGLGRTDTITTIALHSAMGSHCFVRGQDLSEFLRGVQGLSLLVTYNGAAFDLPRIRREFRIDLSIPQLDLKPCLQALGYKGGQKRCEEALGLRRKPEEALRGEDAAALWQRFNEEGEDEALERLARYNLRDAMMLELIAIKVYNWVMATSPIASRLPMPTQDPIHALGLDRVL